MRPLFSLRMAHEHVRASFQRMALSVAAVGLGVALVVAFRLMNASVLASFIDSINALAGRAALTITASEQFTFPEAVAETVANVPGVELAVPLVRSFAYPNDGTGELLTVFGVETTDEAIVRVYRQQDERGAEIDDPLAFLMEAESILIGREFAEGRGLGVGDPIALVTPNGVRRFNIRGLLEPAGIARVLEGRLVVMDLFAAQEMFTSRRRVTQVDVVVSEDASVDTVRRAIADVLPAGLVAHEPAFRKEMVRKNVSGVQAMMSAFSLLGLLAGFVVCYSRLGSIFEMRSWEVGLLRAVGLRRSVVFIELLKESLLIGAAGVVIGLPLGVLIGAFGLPLVARMTALAVHAPMTAVSLKLNVEVLDAFAVGTVVGLLAAALAVALPAAQLARMQPVASLTMRGRETAAYAGRIGWRLRLGLLAFTVALIGLQWIFGWVALGNVTTVVVAFLALASAGPLVLRGGRYLFALFSRLFGPLGEFAAGHLSENARRASLSVATLGIGLGVVLMIGILTRSIEKTTISQLKLRMRTDLVVQSGFAVAGWLHASVSDEILRELRAVPDVAIAVGEQLKDTSSPKGVVTLNSFDRECFVNSRACEWPLERGALAGALETVADGEGILVTSSFARLGDVDTGDTVRVDSPDGEQAFRVVGVTNASPLSAVVMSRDLFRAIWDDSLVRYIFVAVREGVDPAVVRARIERRLGEEYAVEVRPTQVMFERVSEYLREVYGVFYLMEGITLLLVLIAIGDTLASAVAAHAREFGMMRAIGLRRSHLFGMVLLEGAAIGLLGLVLASAMGVALGAFWVKLQLPAITGLGLDFHFPTLLALSAAGLTVLLCLAGSVLPAFQATRQSVSQALRYE